MESSGVTETKGLTPETEKGTTSGTRLGVVILLVSMALWAALAVVPFLPMPGRTKAIAAAAVFAAAEVTFYLGLLLAGKEAAKRIYRRLRIKRTHPADPASVPTDESTPL
jgi:hypothetical protein